MSKPETIITAIATMLAASIASPVADSLPNGKPIMRQPSRSLSYLQQEICWQATKSSDTGGLGIGGGLVCYRAEDGKLTLLPAGANVAYATPPYQRVEIAANKVVVAEISRRGRQLHEDRYKVGEPMPISVRPTLVAATQLQAIVFKVRP